MKELIFILSLFALSFAVAPCGRCVGNGEVCSRDFCTIDYKCQTTKQKGFYPTAALCYPAIKPGVWCNDTNKFFTSGVCQSGFSCDPVTGNCEAIFGSAALNDGCTNNRYCITGLSCQEGVCKLPTDQDCSVRQHCPWNNYCRGNGQDRACAALPGPGDTCTSSGCKFGSSCSSGTCVEDFSIPENGACASTIFCKPGLECYNNLCVKPGYHFLTGPGVVWGQECDPVDGDEGCQCNYASKIFQYLKERSYTYQEACKNVRKDFEKCMIDRGCSTENTFAESCMRKNCYSLYIAKQEACSTAVDVSLRPTRCGAQSMAIMMFLVVILILIL